MFQDPQMTSDSPRRVCVLGCTGSVGQSTLEVIRQHSARFKVTGLACGTNWLSLLALIQEFRPDYVSVATLEAREALSDALKHQEFSPKEVFVGPEGHSQLVESSHPHVMMASMSGTFGLLATLRAIELSVPVLGIANKEVLVMAGSFILEKLRASITQVVPVDSEHSAIFQALRGNRIQEVRRIVLTASGGPFRTLPLEKFSSIRKEEALKHPNWKMGAKITIDSATMMNKGLEFIEAVRLFQIPAHQVEVIIHPQSIIHSMVEYCDRSWMAQLGLSDMRVPISLALTYPERWDLQLSQELDLVKLKSLDFEAPDEKKFPALRLARDAEKMGAAGPVVLNAANEIAVDLFLKDQISFVSIPHLVERALEVHGASSVKSLQEAIALDIEVKSWVRDVNSRSLHIQQSAIEPSYGMMGASWNS